MQAPNDGLREEVAQILDRVTHDVVVGDDAGEESLDQVLEMIEAGANLALESGLDNDGEAELAAVDAWAGLASYAVARFYAPNSPWPWHKGGWSQSAPRRLRRVANSLRPPLERAASALGAASWSVSVGFPWGVSISLTWP